MGPRKEFDMNIVIYMTLVGRELEWSIEGEEVAGGEFFSSEEQHEQV